MSRWNGMGRAVVVLLLVVGACASQAVDESTSSTLDAQTTSTTTAVVVDSVDQEQRPAHLLRIGLPDASDFPGYPAFEEKPSFSRRTIFGDCGPRETMEKFELYGVRSVRFSRSDSRLGHSLGYSDLADGAEEAGLSFQDTADEMVLGLLDFDGCVLAEEDGSEPVAAEEGPEIDGVRELTVWRTQTDEGHWVWATFSMDHGLIGSIRLVDQNEQVEFSDVEPHIEAMVDRVPAVADRINACLESAAMLWDDVTFVAPPGTPAIPEDGDECEGLSADYLSRRWFNLDFPAIPD